VHSIACAGRFDRKRSFDPSEHLVSDRNDKAPAFESLQRLNRCSLL